ncbi:MAG: hypothetical protein Q8936_21235 [Bacillota bacterium]|nr:hypothetical protein [Bacillota bacterium]
MDKSNILISKITYGYDMWHVDSGKRLMVRNVYVEFMYKDIKAEIDIKTDNELSNDEIRDIIVRSL